MERPGTLLVALGVMIALFSALIDVIGVGKSGFGWHQAVGIGIGVGIALAGAVMRSRESGGEPSEPPRA
jgi:hypothetical protein